MLGLTAFSGAAPATLPAQGPVLENMKLDSLCVVSDPQFFGDSRPVAEGLLSESRRLKTGSTTSQDAPLQAARREHVSYDIPKPTGSLGADEGDLDSVDDSPGAEAPNALEIAQRALSLNMVLQSNKGLEEPFSLRWTPGLSFGATEARRAPKEPTQAPLLPLPTGDTMVRATGQQMPIIPAIVQAQKQVQRAGQTRYGPTFSSGVGPRHRQSFHHPCYSPAQPPPASPGPLPAPTPSSRLQPQDGYPSPSQPVFHSSEPIHHRQSVKNKWDSGALGISLAELTRCLALPEH